MKKNIFLIILTIICMFSGLYFSNSLFLTGSNIPAFLVIGLSFVCVFFINYRFGSFKKIINIIKYSYKELYIINWEKRKNNINNTIKITLIIVIFIAIILIYDNIILTFLNNIIK